MSDLIAKLQAVAAQTERSDYVSAKQTPNSPGDKLAKIERFLSSSKSSKS